MKITIHAPERKLPGREYESKRITGVTYEYDHTELPTDTAAREAFIDAVRKRQLAEMDRLEAEIMARHTSTAPPAPRPAPEPTTPEVTAQHTAQATPPADRFICSNTKAHRSACILDARVAEYSVTKFGRPLCRQCQPQRR